MFWELIDTDYADDQLLLNRALNNCHIQWQSGDKNIEHEFIEGRCSNGLRVTALPYSNICRYRCSSDLPPKHYVWHKAAPKKNMGKVAMAKKGRVWFLKNNWMSLIAIDGQRGTKWLHSIYKPITNSTTW